MKESRRKENLTTNDKPNLAYSVAKGDVTNENNVSGQLVNRGFRDTSSTFTAERKKQNQSVIPNQNTIEYQGRLLGGALAACAIADNEEQCVEVKKVCPLNLKALMFAEAIAICAKKEHTEALNLVLSTWPSYLRGNSFGDAMWVCVKENNSVALEIVVKACHEDQKGTALTYAMMASVLGKNKKAFLSLLHACPRKLKVKTLSQVLRDCAKLSNKKAFDRVLKSCPEKLKVEVLSETLAHCALMKNEHPEAFDVIVNALDGDLEQQAAMFGEALAKCAINKNRYALKLVANACPPDIQKTMYDLAIEFCTNAKDAKALKQVKEARPTLLTTLFAKVTSCLIKKKKKSIIANTSGEDANSSDNIKIILKEARKNNAEGRYEKLIDPKNKFSFPTLEDAYPENENETMLYVDDIVSNDEIEEMFHDLTRTLSCDKEELDWIEDACPENPRELMLAQPMNEDTHANDEIEKMYDGWKLALNFYIEEFNQIVGSGLAHPNETLLDQSMNSASRNYEMEMAFRQAMASDAEDSYEEERDRHNDFLSIDLDGKINANDLALSAMIGDKEEFNKIIEKCPHGLEATMYYGAMEFLARQNNSVLFKIIEDACPEDLKTEILADAIASYTRNNDDNALHMINALNPSELKEEMFAQAMADCYIDNNKRALERLSKAYPDSLQGTLLTRAIEICRKKGFTQALERIWVEQKKLSLQKLENPVHREKDKMQKKYPHKINIRNLKSTGRVSI